ncbi:DUF2637 domain-containing protein [Amycolatopsis sp. SID8362]|uniref:DUF2637 domain-containing protein n=1 Tax=Amycolatopsis sp. SID8362 TaxID=2690346 RepID=UPI00136D3AD6|nr:DUF2637 domain-containing protein [Amycolatopsis sp. SID8362]NBH01921.1 DUF2637 domain-containing protein [Amycolatopsis sp. SID8362]NED38624.1 DUF2637 domain-containing protein [Amycolatopsis sp. SID8362]
MSKRDTTTDGFRTSGIVFGALVAFVAAVASYTHMRDLAAKHGETWLSWLVPLSVDGLLVVASLVILRARRDGNPAPGLAWLAVVVGVLVSLVANVASAGPDLVNKVVAAWPPLAFAIAYELVVSLIRPAAANEPAAPAEAELGRQELHQEADQLRPMAGDDLVTSEDVRQEVPPLRERVEEALAAAKATGQRAPGRQALARQLSASQHEIRQVLAELRQEPAKLAIVGREVADG